MFTYHNGGTTTHITSYTSHLRRAFDQVEAFTYTY